MTMKKKKRKIRLSQCMIVKNEEKNIRRALSWGKGIVCEQIVVDTGSTDRTVEIAEEMGAKVYHFRWCNDFSAAKNYAIEQASGDWIAFLDADEYFDRESASKLLETIATAEEMTRAGTMIHVVRTGLANINQAGKVGVIVIHDRIFRNMSSLRYVNKIHEAICLLSGGSYKYLDARNDLVILHTGYTKEAYQETGKTQRNIQMLEKELEANPKNVMALSYLADSYLAERKIDKAKEYYQRAAAYGLEEEGADGNTKGHTLRSLTLLLMIYAKESDPGQEEEVRELHRRYREIYGAQPDGDYYFGAYLYQNKKYEEGKKYLESALDKMRWYKGNIPLYMAANLKLAYAQLADCCIHLDKNEEAVRYCVMSLGVDKYYTESLIILLGRLKKEETERETAAGTWDLLSRLYDLTVLKDQMTVLKGAKLTGFGALERRVYDAMSEDNRRAVQEALAKKAEEMRGHEKSTEDTD